MNAMEGVPPLDSRERLKRRREGFLIVFLCLVFIVLTIAEHQLSELSSTLPFATSILFFALLNFNIIILVALIWLVFRNIGKLFIERRRKILGSHLKSKLVFAFLSFSIIPTLVLFIISATYINSSFDRWFSLKIQNTLQASLEITHTYYRNTDQTAMHFAEHIASSIGNRMSVPLDPIPSWIQKYLNSQRELLALDAVEFYSDGLADRILTQRPGLSMSTGPCPRLSLDVLSQAFSGQRVSIVQHIGTGDLIRCLIPVRAENAPGQPILGVLAVNSYIPVSLINKVDEIASVFDDYKLKTNPLKYPMKTTYLLILIMITLVILFVAIWVGLYMARELTVPVQRLVQGAQAVGAGNLDVRISTKGHDEIAVLVESFNKMTNDLRENRERLAKGQREMAWREVARRIAHEIKNPLTPIKLSAQRLQRRFKDLKGRDGNLLRECTETIIKHTDELKEMVNEFSNFARFPESSPAPNHLNGALTEVITLFKQAHPDITIESKLEERMPIFEFDRDHIKRVMINLFDNAVAALNGLAEAVQKKIKLSTYYHEQLKMAVIEVEDNGFGMTEEVKARVFEPYFSTKAEGTGLGLAIAKRIVNDHDGFIRVRSSPGDGTQFTIELPVLKRS